MMSDVETATDVIPPSSSSDVSVVLASNITNVDNDAYNNSSTNSSGNVIATTSFPAYYLSSFVDFFLSKDIQVKGSVKVLEWFVSHYSYLPANKAIAGGVVGFWGGVFGMGIIFLLVVGYRFVSARASAVYVFVLVV